MPNIKAMMNCNYCTTSHGKIMLPISDHGVIKVENVYRLVTEQSKVYNTGTLGL